MISLVNEIDILPCNAENIKMLETYKLYKDIALFWKESDSNFYISMLDGNMIFSGCPKDLAEIKEFLAMISPSSIFGDYDTLKLLGLEDKTERVNVLYTKANKSISEKSDVLSSKDVYDILTDGKLDMPQYEYFAVDFCHRLNKGRLKYFGIKNKAVALSIGETNVLINGVASLEKGLGTKVLKGVLNENIGQGVFVCCKDAVKPFYIKNGFKDLYFAGYWRK